MATDSQTLVLASGSPYRRRLLERLALPFSWQAPDIDESRREGEDARSMALRLARQKGAAIAAHDSGALILSSDQTAALDTEVLGKPGNREAALSQLRRCAGRRVIFHTAVALTDSSGASRDTVVDTEVTFRELSDAEITRYVDMDEPYDCAGSFRWEGIGITLFSSLRSDDPTALEGLPLISVAAMLRTRGLNPLAGSASV